MATNAHRDDHDQDHDQDQGPSTEDLVLDLRAGAAMLGRRPEAEDIDRYGQYDADQYRERFDTFEAAVDAAGIDDEGKISDLGDVLDAIADTDGGRSR